MLRRLRIIDFPPSTHILEEMLDQNGIESPVIERLKRVFDDCRTAFPTDYETLMPFGHGVFAEVQSEDDLYPLWEQRLRRLLYRPLLDPHAFAETIGAAYPWRDPKFCITSETDA